VTVAKFGLNGTRAVKQAAKPRAFEVIRKTLLPMLRKPSVLAWLRDIRAELERRRQAQMERRRRHEEQQRKRQEEAERKRQEEEEQRRRAEANLERQRQEWQAQAHRRREATNLGANLDSLAVDEQWTLLSNRPRRGQYLWGAA
jgi:Mg-chelatase subunit ChlI